MRIPRLAFTNSSQITPVRVYDDRGEVLWSGYSPRAEFFIQLKRAPKYLVHFYRSSSDYRSIHIRIYEEYAGLLVARRNIASIYENNLAELLKLELPSTLVKHALAWLLHRDFDHE